MKKFLAILVLCTMYIVCAFGLTACNADDSGDATNNQVVNETDDEITENTDENDNNDTQTIYYDVTFEVDSGSVVAAQTVEENTFATQPENPTKDGYNFVGWYKEDKTTSWNFDTDKITANIIIYAKWERITYNVTFDVDGGSVVAVQTVEENTCATQPENPTKDGYNFVGWYKEDKTTSWNFDTDKITANVKAYAKWKEVEHTVTVVGDLLQGVTLTGGATSQTVTVNKIFEPITIAENFGYKYLYYTVDDRKFSDNTITFSNITENKTVKIVCYYATDELPIVNINTDGTTIKSKTDYVNMTFSIENCDDELYDIAGGIRLRGNSTFYYNKKPYRIKFDKKQSLFGLEKAKSWVLLADYLDPSCMHNYTALTLGNKLDGLDFTPTPHHVNVYLNGEYLGLYILCEQVQENKGRIDIEKKITADMTDLKDFNFLICMDYNVIASENAGSSVLDETYFYLEKYKKYIELKYPEKEDFKSEEQFNKFFSDLKVYVTSLFDNFTSNNFAFINDEINIDSLIDYLIVDGIMVERDHINRSFYMYYTGTANNPKENNKLSFGPIWDYDWCLDTPWTNEPNVYYNLYNDIRYRNEFFQSVHDIPELYSQLKVRYNEISSTILSDFIDEIMIYEYSIETSSKLNAEKWYKELDSDIRRKNIVFLNKFLLNRKRVLDIAWQV